MNHYQYHILTNNKYQKSEFELMSCEFEKNVVLQQVVRSDYILLLYVYSVMLSDGNSFCEDVILDSFNMAYRDEHRILDQIYKKANIFYFYYEDLKF